MKTHISSAYVGVLSSICYSSTDMYGTQLCVHIYTC